MKLILADSKQLEGDVRTFVFDSEPSATWVPGQYTHLTIPDDNHDNRGDNRWFTISAAPSDGKLAVSTRIVAKNPSTFKQKMAALQPGDGVEADVPEGDFTLDDEARNYVFVAGGIGITPFRSILTEAAANGSVPRITLLYASSTSDFAFKSELGAIAEKYPSFKITYLVSPQKIDQDLLQKTIDSMENPIVYVSGPEPMVEAFNKTLEEIGLAKENIKSDYFPGYEAF